MLWHLWVKSACTNSTALVCETSEIPPTPTDSQHTFFQQGIVCSQSDVSLQRVTFETSRFSIQPHDFDTFSRPLFGRDTYCKISLIWSKDSFFWPTSCYNRDRPPDTDTGEYLTAASWRITYWNRKQPVRSFSSSDAFSRLAEKKGDVWLAADISLLRR